jgi:hypothetical protein
MSGNRKFTRIPPESTGDRIRVKSHTNIFYDNKALTFVRGQTFSLGTSGLTGTISRVREDTPTSGMISVNYREESEDADSTIPQTSEPIIISGATVALVAATPPTDTYANVSTVVSYDNQYYGQRVSPLGEAYVRFGEGPARVDAAGKLEVQESTVLAQYSFTYDVNPEEFSSILTGTATVSHETPANCMVLTVPTSATSSVIHRSHLYHHYTPGIPVISEFTVAHSDVGKSGQIRRWGLYDENDGLFFELDGTSLNFVRRTSTSGTPVESKIAQADWNNDTLDGTGLQDTNPSASLLDLTSTNAYWIDYTWHGAGIVRFGIFDQGQRIVCHTEVYANTIPVAFTSRGSFPICWEIENTALTGSTTQMRIWSAAVVAGGTIDIIRDGKTFTHYTNNPVTLSGAEAHVVSFRPRDTFNGISNHSVSSFVTINANAWDIVTGDESLVKIRVYVGATLSGETWPGASGTSSLEKSTDATFDSPGFLISEFYLRGDRTWDLESITGYWYRSILKQANGTIPEYTFTAERMFGTNDVAFQMQLRWKEIKG